MSGHDPARWREPAFLAALAVLCAVLAVLQFRWTGELARAEFDRLERARRDGADAFVTAFDRDLTTAVQRLQIDTTQEETDPVPALEAKVHAWNQAHPKPWIRRLGLVRGGNRAEKLWIAELPGGAVGEAEWPAEWATLRNLLNTPRRGPGDMRLVSGDGWSFAIPLMNRPRQGGPQPRGEEGHGLRSFGERKPHLPDERGERLSENRPPPPPDSENPGNRGGPGGRTGPGGDNMPRLIIEMNRSYLLEELLPSLAASYLEPGLRDLYEIRVTTRDGMPVFSQGAGGDAEGSVILPFNRQGREVRREGDALPGGPAEPVWQLEVRRKAGELERMVASARWRNLAVAWAVGALVLLAGGALVWQARRSRRLAAERMDFVANVSHELRTPVAVIIGAAHNLQRGIAKNPESIERYTGMIRQHAEHLGSMVQEVLEFSAAKSGRADYAKQPVAVAEIIRLALEGAESETARMTVEVSVAEDLPPVIGDLPALTRAAGNLIRNAARHASAGGWIGVRAERRGGKIALHVSDCGPGVPMAEQAEIFQPFHRGSAAKKAQVRGSGLGLGLVREIVTAHGGEVFVCNGTEQGATFTLVLPAAPDLPVDDRPHPARGR